MGSEIQVHMSLGAYQAIGVFRERVQARPGTTINLRPDLAHVYLFDAATGLRIN
ncbi:hypothetical protein [Devosia sp. CAU 1758]